MSELTGPNNNESHDHMLQLRANSKLARFLRRQNKRRDGRDNQLVNNDGFVTVHMSIIKSILPKYLMHKLKCPLGFRYPRSIRHTDAQHASLTKEEELFRLQKELEIAVNQRHSLQLSHEELARRVSGSEELHRIKLNRIILLLLALVGKTPKMLQELFKEYFPRCKIDVEHPLIKDQITDSMHFIGKKLYIEGIEGDSPFDLLFDNLLRLIPSNETPPADLMQEYTVQPLKDVNCFGYGVGFDNLEFEFNLKLNSCWSDTSDQLSFNPN